jgi:uncharacterized protein
MTRPPHRIWVLLGDKAGDNAQLRSLARALEGEDSRELRFFDLGRIGKPAGPGRWWAPSFDTLQDSGASLTAALAEGHPDLIVFSGRRAVPVARELRRRSPKAAKLVALGRPRAPLDWFDLVLTTPQYGLPPHPRVLHLDLPILGVSAELSGEEETRWRDRLAGERPFHAVLVGGDVDPWRFDDAALNRLVQQLQDFAARENVDLALTAGRRLPPTSAEVLRLLLDSGGRLRHFHAAAADGGENPYRAYLKLAAGFVVTVDSVSMMAEAAATGRPLRLFRPTRRPRLSRRLASRLLAALRRCLSTARYEALVARAWIVPLRRSDRVAARLLNRGRAEDLAAVSEEKRIDHAPPARGETCSPPVEERILERIRSLFDEEEATG